MVRGRVQGVGYRSFVTDCALKTGITGFVRNLPDGSVMIVAEGSDEILEKFFLMVQAEDDPLIRIEETEVTRSRPTGEFSGFGIRW